MRAYLPISHKELEAFVLSKSIDADEVFAPTQAFVTDNLDCDEEELEYLLSVAAGEEALELRLSEKAPGIVLAFDVWMCTTTAQCGQRSSDHRAHDLDEQGKAVTFVRAERQQPGGFIGIGGWFT